MATTDFVYLIPYVLSAGTSIAIAIYAWNRGVDGSRQFALLALAQAVATIGFTFEVSSDSLETKMYWSNVQTVAFLVWPMAYLAFAIRYTGREMPGGRRTWIWLATPFLLFLALLFSDSLHGLIRSNVRIEQGDPFSALVISYTTPIYLAGIYSYLFILSAIYLLARKYLEPSPLSRGQVATVLLGTLIPILVNILTTAGIRVGFQSDPTPITFTLGNLVVAWGLYRYRLFQLAPVARDSLVESMREGVIVLDLEDRIVDANPAAGELLRRRSTALLGKPAEEALADWPEILRAASSGVPRIELTLEGEPIPAVLAINIESVDERQGQPGGRMVLLRDISKLKAMERELERHHEELEALVVQRTAALTAVNAQLREQIEERLRAEQALMLSETKLVQFLNTLPLGVVVHGLDTKPHYVNQHAMEMLGMSPARARGVGAEYSLNLEDGLRDFPIYHAESGEAFGNDEIPIVRALKGERVREQHLELASPDQRIPLEVLSSPIFDEQGQVRYAVTAFQDISDRVRLEEALNGIYELGRDLALIRDEDAIGQRVVEEAHHLLDFELAGFGLADEPNCQLIYSYSILGTDEQEMELRLPLDGRSPQSISAQVYRTGQGMNVPDVSIEPLYYLETVDWDGRSELCVPIRVGDRVLGVLNAESRQLDRFSPDDERLLQALADQCGVAVENARLYSQLQQRLKEQTALQNAVSSISSTIELDTVLEEIASRLAEAIDATSAFICAFDQQRMTSEVIAHYAGSRANDNERYSAPEGPYSLPENYPGTLQKLERNQPAVSHIDDSELPEAQRRHYMDFNVQTSLFIPMSVGGRLVAYADLWDSERRREFTAQEIALCEGIALQAAVAIENARLYRKAQDELVERRRIERQLQQYQEELEELVLERTAKLSEAGERLATLNDASHFLAVASVNMDQVHRTIHQAASWLMSAELFRITKVDHEAGVAEDVYVAGEEEPVVGSPYPLAGSLVEYMFQRGQSLRIDDIRLSSGRNSPIKQYLDPETRSAMVVLLPGAERDVGILLAQCKSGESYSEEDEKSLEMLAAHAATAIENAELYQVAQRAAADQERQRLARHLHDSVTQSLYSLTLMTNGWAAMSEKGELQDPADSFRQLEGLGVQALSEMRLLIHQLRPPVLDETGLVGALQDRLEAVEHRVGLETKLETAGNLDRIPKQIEEELFHITQEALNNALRHAEASNIWVRIEVENGSARLAVRDNGGGFDPDRVNGGLGLTSMRERAESVGGEFALNTGSGRGTVVEVSLDLK